jgi:hypothetical protein
MDDISVAKVCNISMKKVTYKLMERVDTEGQIATAKVTCKKNNMNITLSVRPSRFLVISTPTKPHIGFL